MTLGRDGSGHLDSWTRQTTTGTQTVTSSIQYSYRGDGSLEQIPGAGTFEYPKLGPKGCGFLFWRHPCPGPPDGVAQTKGMSYKYDHAGQMTQLGTHSLSWNADGQLAWVQQSPNLWTHYVYDPSGTLVYSGTSTTGPSGHDTSYAGTRIYGSLATTNGSNTPDSLTRHYYFDGRLVSTSDQAGDQLVIPDQNGSPEALYGPGTATQQRFTLYGSPIGTSPQPKPGEGYLGSWAHDPATGIVLLGARWYDPAIGQFLSPDPLYASTAPPGAGTAYSYANDDPATYIDPSGLDTCEQSDGNCDDQGGSEQDQGDKVAQPGSGVKPPGYVYAGNGVTYSVGPEMAAFCCSPPPGGDPLGGAADDTIAAPAEGSAASGGGGGGNMAASSAGEIATSFATELAKGATSGAAWAVAIAATLPVAGTAAPFIGAGLALYVGFQLGQAAANLYFARNTLTGSQWAGIAGQTLGPVVGGFAGGALAGAGGIVAAEDGAPAMSQMERVGSGLNGDLFHRSVSWVVDNPAAQMFAITGGDGVVRDLYQLPGELNGKPGIYEWIVDRSGSEPVITHQRFIPGGSLTGGPNQ